MLQQPARLTMLACATVVPCGLGARCVLKPRRRSARSVLSLARCRASWQAPGVHTNGQQTSKPPPILLRRRARPPPPLRRHSRLLPARPAPRARLAVVAAAAGDGDAPSEFAQLVAGGGPPRKTAVSKLPVVELRAECERLGLPADGLKADLVDRLLAWWAQQQQQGEAAQQAAHPAQVQPPPPQQQQQQQQQAAVPAPAPRAAAAPAAAAPPQPAGQAPQRGAAPVPAERVAVTWLGTSSGNPTPRRNVSCIAVQYDEDVYLVDAGEGSRNQVRAGWRRRWRSGRRHDGGPRCSSEGACVYAAARRARAAASPCRSSASLPSLPPARCARAAWTWRACAASLSPTCTATTASAPAACWPPSARCAGLAGVRRAEDAWPPPPLLLLPARVEWAAGNSR